MRFSRILLIFQFITIECDYFYAKYNSIFLTSISLHIVLLDFLYYAGRFEEIPGLNCKDVYGALVTDLKFIALYASNELPYICQYAGTLLLIPLNVK